MANPRGLSDAHTDIARTLPAAVLHSLEDIEQRFLVAYLEDYAARRKSVAMAYLAWLLLGWHYLYLGRVGVQLAFWLTLGGFFLWWLLDIVRVPDLVQRANHDLARELVVQYRVMASARPVAP